MPPRSYDDDFLDAADLFGGASNNITRAVKYFDDIILKSLECNTELKESMSNSANKEPVIICVDNQNDLTYDDYYKILYDSVTRYVTENKVDNSGINDGSDNSMKTVSLRRKRDSLLTAIIHEAAHIYMSLLNNYKLNRCEIKAVNLLINRTGAYGKDHSNHDDIKEWHTATQIIENTTCKDVDLSYTEFETVPAFTSIGTDTLVHLCAGDILTKELGLGIKYSLKSDLLECRNLFIDYYERSTGLLFSDLSADERRGVSNQWMKCLEECKAKVLEYKYDIVKLAAYMATDLSKNYRSSTYEPRWVAVSDSLEALWSAAYSTVPNLDIRVQFDSKNKLDIKIKRNNQ